MLFLFQQRYESRELFSQIYIITLAVSMHCVKSVRIRGCSGPYFPAFELNTDQHNSEYRHSLRSDAPLMAA